jgi:rare lipoprotein A
MVLAWFMVYRPGMHTFHASRGLGLALATCLVLLAGCATSPEPAGPSRDGPPSLPPPPAVWDEAPVEPKVEPIREGGPNKPYEVLGERYEPLTVDEPWREQGLASWYGAKFHGRRTASGELYSMYGMTAAHKTLPIPSYVRVRSKRNGQEVILRVNDRGPFVKGRVIDVSYAAAIRLGLVGAGVGEVEVERLTFEDIRTGAWKQTGSSVAQASGGGAAVTPVALATAPPLAPASRPLTDPAGLSASAQTSPVGPPSSLTPVTLPGPETRPAAPPVAEPPALARPPATAADTSPLPVSRAHTPAGRGFWVQLAALSRRDGVDRLQQRVARELSGLLPLLGIFQEQQLYKLKIGPFSTRAEAQDAAHRARDALQLQPMVVHRR